MLRLLNKFVQESPVCLPDGSPPPTPPIYAILAQAIATQGGFSAFLSSELNKQFKKVFEVWAGFLKSDASRKTALSKTIPGWFNETALKALAKDYQDKPDDPDSLERPFDEIYVCDTSRDDYGFISFDDFFNRTFRDGIRPISGLDVPEGKDPIISGACESILYNDPYNPSDPKSKGPRPMVGDEFWIKGERYSIRDMLNHDFEYADKFDGGQVYQGFLQVTGYHRWHSPVTGTIKKIVPLAGTYFVQSPALLDEPAIDPDDPKYDNFVPPYLRSLAFVTSITTRTLIFIEADNKNIGLMCFIAIGMTEISTCEVTVGENQRITRGDQLGMFHFGGSSHALVFRKETEINWDGDYSKKGQLIRVRQPIGYVEPPKSPW
jgi:phosphatidylserine decarboxylase